MTKMTNKFRAEFKLTDNGTDAKSAKVQIVARSGDPIEHPYWGRIAHDFAGMEVAGKIPLDYAHDCFDSIGYLNKFDYSTGDLVCSGAIVPFNNDKGAEVIAKVGEGVPYEASIEWDMNATLEYIPEGVTVFINPSPDQPNGRPVEGPATIVRQWQLIAVAVCKFGADSETSTELQLSKLKKPEKRMFIKIGDTQMSEEKKIEPVVEVKAEPVAEVADVKTELADVDTGVKAEESKPVEAPAVEAKPEPVEAPALKAAAVETFDPRAEAKKFIECFGEQSGVKYFAQGLQFSDAMTAHVKCQAEQIEQLQKRLKSSDRGAIEPVTFNDESKGEKKAKFSDVFAINKKEKSAK